MPSCLRILCLTNLLCWSAHICYSLYFTDFVGEAVFKGDPKVGISVFVSSKENPKVGIPVYVS
jgi:hypothetical protein